MKRLQLDFSTQHLRMRNSLGGAALMICLLAGFALLVNQRSLDQRIASYAAVEKRPDKHDGSAALDPLLIAEEKQAGEAQLALQLPWDALFTALEQVQSGSSGIHLLSIQPNPGKKEVVLEGEAKDFPTLMIYVKSLRAQPQFSDVVLVNQRLSEIGESQSLIFTLQAQWKLGKF